MLHFDDVLQYLFQQLKQTSDPPPHTFSAADEEKLKLNNIFCHEITS